jgi:hypothetical protein
MYWFNLDLINFRNNLADYSKGKYEDTKRRREGTKANSGRHF